MKGKNQLEINWDQSSHILVDFQLKKNVLCKYSIKCKILQTNSQVPHFQTLGAALLKISVILIWHKNGSF